ncbi:MAG: helix-turn-helix transcriptional regulator [Clostridia bacterium]|nr:helix-turn-helix transcriptional regulator [Clostridia bacterium]
MDIKEVLNRIGYVRNQSNLSARELSLRIGMSQQYIGKIEGGHIVLTVEKLLQILEVCNFPLDRFFSKNIFEYNEDKELQNLISALPLDKKKHIIEFIKK